MDVGMILISVLISASTAAGVYFLLSWQLRSRVRACEFEVTLALHEVMRGKKQLAGEASAAARRTRATNPDEALIAAAAAQQAAQLGPLEPPAPAGWWAGLKRKEHDDGT